MTRGRQADAASRAHRLAPGVLGLAHAMRSGCPELAVAAPLMLRVAERPRIQVGLAAPDRDAVRMAGRIDGALRTAAQG